MIEQIESEIETIDKQIKELESRKAQFQREIESTREDTGEPVCYSCGGKFEPKMLCYSKRLASYKQQLRCISCAYRYNLVTRTELEFLRLGLEQHNRLKPEVMEIVKSG